MRHFFITVAFICTSVFCYAQQDMPSRIVGRIPQPNSLSMYQIQVGAFSHEQNAVNVSGKLKNSGFNVILEDFNALTRVIVTGIPARDITASLRAIKNLGFDSVVIREESAVVRKELVVVKEEPVALAFAEKWVITKGGSNFQSFEFTRDNRFIVAEEGAYGLMLVHFGEYTMPRSDVITLNDFGTVSIRQRDGNKLDFSFSSVDKPLRRTHFAAVKESPMPNTPETNLFARTWEVVNSTDEEDVGMIFLFSIHGTYLVSRPDGTSFLSQRRWHNEERNEFEYSHDDWWSYGRARVTTLQQTSLIFADPGQYGFKKGYSTGDLELIQELTPVTK